MKQVIEWLKTQRTGRRFALRDHYALHPPWWYFKRSWSDTHINLIGVETPTLFYGGDRDYDDAKYLAAINDIVVPYPDQDSILFYTEERLAKSKKDLMAIFVGGVPIDGK